MQQLITAGLVLTGPAGQHIDDGAVLIDGDTIIAVGPRAEVEQQVAGTARRRDHPDSTVPPGLINCHVHLCFDTSTDPVASLWAADDSALLQDMAVRAQQLLHAGVTTARDLGDRGGLTIKLRDAVIRGDTAGPRLVVAGAPLTPPGGHCWFLGGEVDGIGAIRAQVRHNARRGVDVIKVMASGGQLTPDSPAMWESQFSSEQLRVVVEEAAEAGLPVAAHAHGTEAITSAVAAGVTTIEHCTWMGRDSIDRRADVAVDMADRRIYACAASSRNWRTLVEKAGPERAEQIYGRLTWLAELGVPLITGTDAGLPNSVFDDFVGALELYEYLGFTPGRVLEMATVTSAAALGLAGHAGQLRPGYSADLLVVQGDPRAGLGALRNRQLVLARGRDSDLAAG